MADERRESRERMERLLEATRIGQLLETTREHHGLSLEEVERSTTIHARQLRMLEEGNFEALRDSLWARAFLIRYANLLGLEGEELAERVFPLDRTPVREGFLSRHRRAIVVGLSAMVVAMMTLAALAVLQPEVLRPIAGDEPRYVVLVLNAGEEAYGDSVVVARISQEDSSLLFIPGNTLVEIPGHGDGEIMDALALGGADLVRQSVVRLTEVEVPHYVVVDAEGVREIVDTMGGVRVDVPDSMSGRSFPDGPLLTLRPGPRTLDGDQALVYLQGEDLSSNLERAERQRIFLYATLRQAFEIRNLLSNPTTVYAVIKNTQTNMSSIETIRLAGYIRALDGSDAPLQMDTIPGREEGSADDAESQWVLNDRELPDTLQETLK
jgi:LCP family protein required for cell wall assembly